MPSRGLRVCNVPGCPILTDTGRCVGCRHKADRERGTAAERGYDSRWARRRARYLSRHPFCVLCHRQARVADHFPDSRRDLVAAGVRDPDADHRLRALCLPCHAVETAREQPGGWNAVTQSDRVEEAESDIPGV